MAALEEVLSYKELIDYTKTRTPQAKILEELYPSRKTEALEIRMIRGANNLPVSASIHAFDTEAEIDQREITGYDVAELALIKRKRKLSEKEIIHLEQPRNDAEEQEAVNKIYNDVDTLQDSVQTRVEAMRGEALATGKLVINENGYKATIDYGVPAAHKKAFSWSSGTPDILDDLDTAVDKIVDDTGFTPTRILTSKKNLNIMLKNEKIRKAVFGVNSDRLLSKQELNTFLKAFGLPQIANYDAKFRVLTPKGTYITKRYFPENAFVFMPDGQLGETLFGLTAEELELRKKPDVDITEIGNVIIDRYATNDPVAKWIKAVATALVTFPCADQVFMATIE